LGCPRAELSIVITDDATIHDLNRQWRHKDRPTDVLSFSQVEGLCPGAPSEEQLLGDVVISLETAARQAKELGHSLEQEVQRLLVHGVLHLLGHDHVHGGWQARRMQGEERRVLRALGRGSRT
jgi:probable rRNA maturation factor